ncbi:MAG: phosphomannose isomerase type II C-terminal cupin domain, partial [Akkermansia sp.]
VVKLLTLRPHHRLSLQRHLHRRECWTICRGSLLVTIDDKEHVLTSGETVCIPASTWHRLSNISDINAIIIEVQFGKILSEDDIERTDDDYGR